MHFQVSVFNKYHELFCTIRGFVHTYHMAGQILEESNKAFNGTLAFTKTNLRSMQSTNNRVQVTTVQTQGNLKGGILNDKLTIQRRLDKGKRGPQRAKEKVIDKRSIITGAREVVQFDGG